MIKAVNMKNYKFKVSKSMSVCYIGFGAYDEEKNEFLSFDGKKPYVLEKKKIIQSVIDANWSETMNRVKYNPMA